MNFFSLAYYSYSWRAQLLHRGLLSDLDHTQVSSVLIGKTWHLSSKRSLRVKQFAFIICRQEMTNWKYAICWEKEGTNLNFPHNSTCCLPLCLTLLPVVFILLDLPYQEIPSILFCLQGWLVCQCGCPLLWLVHTICFLLLPTFLLVVLLCR